MISYYELMVLVKEKKQPYKILVPVDKDRELLFGFSEKYNTYYVIPTSVTESYYEEYEKYLDLNMFECNIFYKNIKVVQPYIFKIGEYVSYFDLVTSIKFNTQPYKVRLHINATYHDYIFDSLDSSEEKQYILNEDDGVIPSWNFYLLHQVTDRNWFESNLEIIEAGNSLIQIKEGSDSGSSFSIAAVKIKDLNSNTDDDSNIEDVWDDVISIEESDFENFLYPLVSKYFDSNILENKNRYGTREGFEWYLTNNYFTFSSVRKMIDELKNIMILLKDDYNNPKLDFIKKNYDWILYLDTRVDSRNIGRHGENPELINYVNEIVNFYKRFIDYMERIIDKSEKEGYRLISFYGP